MIPTCTCSIVPTVHYSTVLAFPFLVDPEEVLEWIDDCTPMMHVIAKIRKLHIVTLLTMSNVDLRYKLEKFFFSGSYLCADEQQ